MEILEYIIIGCAVYFATQFLLKILLYAIKTLHEKRVKKKEEKSKWKYARITPDNIILKQIINNRLICFKGSPGTGKSIMMNILSKFIFDQRNEYNERNKRYNKIMRPDYLEVERKLIEDNKLPVYSNLEFKDINLGRTSNELMPYIQMQKRAVKGGVLCIDENSSLFGKELYNQQQKEEDPIIKEMVELFKKIRHYINGWILMTEQGGQNIYIRFREAGFATVEALGTSVCLTSWGKFKRIFFNLCNILLPGWITANKKRVKQYTLFNDDRNKLKLKLLLPTYFLLPKEFYTRKKEINDKIKFKHTQFITRFRYNNQEFFLKYSNKDKFIYETRAYAGEYASKFNKNGERIKDYGKR